MICGRADCCSAEGAGGRREGGRPLPQAWDFGRDILQLESQTRHGGFRGEASLKALEEENAKLKKLLAEQMLDATPLRELLAKNVWSALSMQGVATP
ncbi:Mobile element protein (plasmid) [Sinorhizobium fredii CCBAU 83666]|nr:Mobile element protein [Sinorhizobium fredii CCBAU 83666]